MHVYPEIACEIKGHDWSAWSPWTPIMQPISLSFCKPSDEELLKPTPMKAVRERACARCKRVIEYQDYQGNSRYLAYGRAFHNLKAAGKDVEKLT